MELICQLIPSSFDVSSPIVPGNVLLGRDLPVIAGQEVQTFERITHKTPSRSRTHE